ncbi:MAG: N-acetylmuramic acid 6-phosphate etherase [Acidobacteria bacterium]|nr:N-acetylmuramic acid 6-phosphate etherase [Acidobacteriota bacterium]MCA1617478.1 N-acetylmuramic acid 6-phosphate etherase [Acidobacteriota bacterium]
MKAPTPSWRRLATEGVHPGAARLDRIGIAGVVRLMQAEDRRAVSAVVAARPEIVRAAEWLRETFLAGGTCLLFGAGTSGRLAVVEAAELPPTFGTDPRRVRAVMAGGRSAVFRAREGAEDRANEGDRAAARLRPSDLAIGVSASSVTPFVRGALSRARRRGARTVLVTASGSPGLDAVADVIVRLAVGPEVLAGSTRLKAGTATKLALNQITTSALAASGKVYGPWMVDLRAGSAKLQDRSRRIVGAAAGVSARRAARLLSRAGGEVKTAILMGRTGSSPQDARAVLARAKGDLRSALEGKARR